MGSGEYLPLNPFPCDSTSRWLHAGVVPVHGAATDTFLLDLNFLMLSVNL